MAEAKPVPNAAFSDEVCDAALNVYDGEALQVWLRSLRAEPSVHAQAALSSDERERAARFRFPHDRRRYLASHVFLRDTLSRSTGMAAAQLHFGAGACGKPFLAARPECRFNLSHAGDHALVAIADGACVGVDLEPERAIDDALALGRSVYTAAENAVLAGLAPRARDRAFLRLWTRKEACLKALGSGFAIDAATVHVGLDTEMVTVAIGATEVAVAVRSFVPAPGLVAAVAWLSPADARRAEAAWIPLDAAA